MSKYFPSLPNKQNMTCLKKDWDILFIVLFFLSAYNAFLLDGRTQTSFSTKRVVASDQFNFLKDLIMKERQARTLLQNQMGFLQKQLRAHQEKHILLISKFTQLEKELDNLKNQKESSELKMIGNHTKSLEQQLQRIDKTQSNFHQFFISETNRLKQDIVTLCRMEQNSSKEIAMTHTMFANVTTVLNQKVQNTQLSIRQNWNMTKTFLNVVLSNEFRTNDRILALESNISKTYANVVQKLGAWSDRALFSAWPDTQTVQAGEEIPFTKIQTSRGIKDVSPIRNHGRFICEKDGFYLVSCFIRTDTSSAKFRIEKNNDIIAAGTKHGDTGFESHAAVVAVQLNVGDVLHVTAGDTMVVDSKFDSVFTVVQII